MYREIRSTNGTNKIYYFILPVSGMRPRKEFTMCLDKITFPEESRSSGQDPRKDGEKPKSCSLRWPEKEEDAVRGSSARLSFIHTTQPATKKNLIER